MNLGHGSLTHDGQRFHDARAVRPGRGLRQVRRACVACSCCPSRRRRVLCAIRSPVRLWPRDGGAKEQLAGKNPFSTDELLQFYGCVGACLRGHGRCGALRAGARLMFPRWLWSRKQVVQAGDAGRLQYSAARRLEHRGAGQVERMEQDEGPVSRRMPFPLPQAALRQSPPGLDPVAES